jgi:hypothetical protein
MTKRNKIIYWISTIWLASGMLSTGALQLFKVKAQGAVAPPGVYGITHLGYPVYFLTILGIGEVGVGMNFTGKLTIEPEEEASACGGRRLR